MCKYIKLLLPLLLLCGQPAYSTMMPPEESCAFNCTVEKEEYSVWHEESGREYFEVSKEVIKEVFFEEITSTFSRQQGLRINCMPSAAYDRQYTIALYFGTSGQGFSVVGINMYDINGNLANRCNNNYRNYGSATTTTNRWSEWTRYFEISSGWRDYTDGWFENHSRDVYTCVANSTPTPTPTPPDPVPEPTTLLLFGGGLIGLVSLSKHRKLMKKG